ncbi:unnamed protein product [Caretta caretta]
MIHRGSIDYKGAEKKQESTGWEWYNLPDEALEPKCKGTANFAIASVNYGPDSGILTDIEEYSNLHRVSRWGGEESVVKSTTQHD